MVTSRPDDRLRCWLKKCRFWGDTIWLHLGLRVIPNKTVILLQNMAAGCAPFRALGRRERD